MNKLKNNKKLIITTILFILITIILYSIIKSFHSSDIEINNQLVSESYFPVNLQGHQFQNPFLSGFESLGFYVFTKNDELFQFQLIFGHLGFYNQLELSYNLMTVDNNPPNIIKSISCSINSLKVQNNSLKIISDCVDIETILDESTGKSKKIVKFKQLSEISGEFEFNSVDSGIQMWSKDGIINFDGDSNSGRYIKKNYIISNNVIGKINIEGREVNLDGEGIQGGIKFGVIPNLIYQRLNFFVFKSKLKKLVVFEVITTGEHTKDDNNGKVGYCFLYNGSKLEFVTSDYNLTFDEYSDEESGHPLIKNTQLKVENKYNQKQYSLQLTDIKPNFKIDVLDMLPTIIKKIVQALITNPYIFTYYENSKLEVKNNKGTESDSGIGFITSNFL